MQLETHPNIKSSHICVWKPVAATLSRCGASKHACIHFESEIGTLAASRVLINLHLDTFVHGHLLDDIEEAQQPSRPVNQFSGSDLSAQCLPSPPVATPWKRRASPGADIILRLAGYSFIWHTHTHKVQPAVSWPWVCWSCVPLLERRSGNACQPKISHELKKTQWVSMSTLQVFHQAKYLVALSSEATESFDFRSTDFVKLLSELVAWGYPCILI